MTTLKHESASERGKTSSPALTDRRGGIVPSALPSVDTEEVTLLRVLGRLELMTLTQIQQAVYPSYTIRGVQKRLQQLLHDDLLWRVQTRLVAANHAAEFAKVRKQAAYAYGLSDYGKELLNTLEVEHDPLTLNRLVSRDPKGRKPDLRTLSHDLQVSWWCLNVLLDAAENRYCRKIYVQTEFYPEKSQRIDALIILRLSPDHPRSEQEMGMIPFFDGKGLQPGEVDIRFALEVDKGTEELKVLLEKATRYRELHKLGVYTATLGGPVLPIFLVQTPRRAAQIAREFQDIWPTGWGVTGTPFSANSQRDGVLWGKYKTLTRAEPYDLLTNMVVDQQGRVQFFSTISREEWRNGIVAFDRTQLSPIQAIARKAGQARAAKAQARHNEQRG